MIDRIKSFFSERLQPTSQDAEHRLRLATAALLVEVCRADMEISAQERAAVHSAVREVYGLSAEDTAALVALAEDEVDEATSLYGFTRLVNDHFSAEEKARIIELMWRVAYVDDYIEKHEQHLMRKVTSLLYIPHETYIAAKFRARQAARRERD